MNASYALRLAPAETWCDVNRPLRSAPKALLASVSRASTARTSVPSLEMMSPRYLKKKEDDGHRQPAWQLHASERSAPSYVAASAYTWTCGGAGHNLKKNFDSLIPGEQS